MTTWIFFTILLILVLFSSACATKNQRKVKVGELNTMVAEALLKWNVYLNTDKAVPSEIGRVNAAFDSFRFHIAFAEGSKEEYANAMEATLNFVELVNQLVVPPVP